MRWPPRAARGAAEAAVSRSPRTIGASEPLALVDHFFAVMRRLERSYPGPRRASATARRAATNMSRSGRIPILDFPASNIARGRAATRRAGCALFVKFLGLLGPAGRAAAGDDRGELSTGCLRRDDAFPRFLDIFNNRFLQLFFRAWADARPIVQHDRPGRRSLRRLCRLDDRRRLAALSRAATALPTPDEARALPGLLGAAGEIAPRGCAACSPGCSASRSRSTSSSAPGWSSSAQRAHTPRTPATARSAAIPCSARASSASQDKFRVRHLRARSRSNIERFLPIGDRCEPLADAVFFYLGEQLEWDVELAIPAGEVEPMRLGRFGQLGWTSWMAPNWSTKDAYRCDARFHPAESAALQREAAAPPDSAKGTTMADISLEAVTGKLNRVGYDAFIQALRQAKSAGNRNVELAHWLLHILQSERTDIDLTADHFKLDRAKLLTRPRRRRSTGFRKNETEMPGIVQHSHRRARPRLALRHAVLRRDADPHRPCARRRAEVAGAAPRAASAVRASSTRSPSMRWRPSIAHDLGGLGGREPASDGRLGPARRRHARREAAAGRAGHDRARPLLAGSHREGRAPARWIRSSAATRRFARSSTC